MNQNLITQLKNDFSTPDNHKLSKRKTTPTAKSVKTKLKTIDANSETKSDQEEYNAL